MLKAKMVWAPEIRKVMYLIPQESKAIYEKPL